MDSKKSSQKKRPSRSRSGDRSGPSKSDFSSVSKKTWKDEAVEQLGPIETFFDTKYTNFVKRFKLLIILVCITVAVYSGIRSREIQGLTQMEQLFAEDHPLSQGYRKAVYGFNEGDQG